MHSTRALALTSLVMMSVGLFAWVFLHRQWPEIGRSHAGDLPVA
jgi:MFS transporter, DHA1 family, multidrug resistance protein